MQEERSISFKKKTFLEKKNIKVAELIWAAAGGLLFGYALIQILG
jgi:hypothetical protein